MRNRFSRLTFMTMAFAAVWTIAVGAQTKPVPPKGQAPKTTVTLTTKPTPPVAGNVEFHATVTDDSPARKPVNGAVVSLAITMPAMPAMKMAAMNTSATLKPVSDKAEDAGKYVGTGKVPTPGTWDVTMTVKVKGQVLTTQKLKLDVK